MNNSSDELRKELTALGAREFELVALGVDPDRGLAALRLAQQRGVERPIPYALHLFDAADWQPSGASRAVATNVHVDVRCDHCGGDRFAFVTDDPGPYGETVAPCKVCNADADTGFWRVDGTRAKPVAL